MKTKLLSILLTVAMLAAMIPVLGVVALAEENTATAGTVFEVTDAASITALIADTEKNVVGNTMKLTQDITYDPQTAALWAGLAMDVDGNGHKVILKDGTYGCVLLFTPVDGTAKDPHKQTLKNLAIVMENDEAKVTSNEKIILSFFGQAHASANNAIQFNNVHINLENCYFDVNMNSTATGAANTACSILIAHVIGAVNLEITAKNTYFKATLDTDQGAGAVGAIYGRRWNHSALIPVKINLENCGFDVNSNNATAKTAVVGNVCADTALQLNATGVNLIYNDAVIADMGEFTGVDTIVNEMELATNDWKLTNTGYPIPVALETNFGTLFADKALNGITVTITAPSTGGDTTPDGGTTPGGDPTPGDDETDAPETNAPETNAPETNATTTAATAEEESGCASVVGGTAVVMIAVAAAFVCKKKED